MNGIQLPPALLYGVGVVLMVFGALRAYTLGWKQRPRAQARAMEKLEKLAGGDEYGQLPAEEAPQTPEAKEQAENRAAGWSPAGGTHKRHLFFGVLWVLMGAFLVVTTIVHSR
jgi:hypothetical protein